MINLLYQKENDPFLVLDVEPLKKHSYQLNDLWKQIGECFSQNSIYVKKHSLGITRALNTIRKIISIYWKD